IRSDLGWYPHNQEDLKSFFLAVPIREWRHARRKVDLGAPYLTAPAAARPPDKGNVRILRGVDGKLKSAVTLDVARRFGGVSRRAIEKAVKKESLQAEGDRQNRRILVPSLLKYFPPENM